MRAVDPNRTGTWRLTASQQEEMDGAIVMLQEAMDQVSERLGEIRWGHADLRSPIICLTQSLHPC